MESKQYRQIDSWFKKLNTRFDETNRKIDNRHAALLVVCTNIRKDLDGLRKSLVETKNKYEARMSTLELALQELERRLAH